MSVAVQPYPIPLTLSANLVSALNNPRGVLRAAAHRDGEGRHAEEQEIEDRGGFLRRLRQAKDKAEFDQFMAERRDRTGPSSASHS